MPNLQDLLLWGIPVVAFVAAVVAFLKTMVKETVAELIGNLLFMILAFVVIAQEQWSGQYPEVEQWVMFGFWAITLTLIRMGFYPALRLSLQRFAARYL